METSIFMRDRGFDNIYHVLILSIYSLKNVAFIPTKIYINSNSNINYISQILKILYPETTLINLKYIPSKCLHVQPDDENNISRESISTVIDYNRYRYLRDLFMPCIKKFKPLTLYSKHIYISRCKDGNKRRILNERELFKNNLYDIQTINMSELSALEQMYVFNNANLIISVHGAALTNILFCNKDTKIIEIASPKMSKLLHFEHIANSLNLNHSRYCNVTETIPNNYESDLLINKSDFELFIKKILQ